MTIDDVRAVACRLPRSYEALVADRVKFRVGRIVYLAFSRDETIMGFAFPKEEREALVASEPRKFQMPRPSDLRYHWVHVRLSAIDHTEMRELVLDAWRMVVPKRVAEQYDASVDAERPLAAGPFPSWVTAIRAAIAEGRTMDVPCAGCTACCRSRQFVQVGADETDTLAHIPKALLVRDPKGPPGQMVLGYDERGHCPMLVDDQCSIYQHRPRACRTYDCRVFAAAGVEVEPDQPEVGRRARRWRFEYPTDADRVEHEAAAAAARYLARHPDLAPATAGRRAVLALEIRHLFVRRDPRTGETRVGRPGGGTVEAELQRRRTGHWPQFTKPHELAQVILDAVDRG